MVSTTSGTVGFTMDVDDIISHALIPLGGEHTSGIQMDDARVSLNLILIELQNKNIPLSKLDTVTLTLVADTQEYDLDASIVDVLNTTLLISGTETPLERWGAKSWHDIPIKTTRERPTLYSTDRLIDNVRIKFWPIPNNDTYTVKLLVSKKVEDITASYQKVDLPTRYLPLLVKWLSYELALGGKNTDKDMVALLKLRLEEVMPDTFEEDRERTNFSIKPGGISGR